MAAATMADAVNAADASASGPSTNTSSGFGTVK